MGDTQPRRLEELLAREIGLFLISAALALLQVTLLTTPLGFSAPLLLVLTVSRVLIGVSSAFPDAGVMRGLRLGLYGGLTLDILGATPLGSHALALLLAALIVAAATRRLRIEGPIMPLLSMLAGGLIYELTLGLIVQPSPIDWPSYGRVVILPVVLVALIMTLPLFFGLRWMLRGEL